MPSGWLCRLAFVIMIRAYTPNNVAGTTEAGQVGEEQQRKVRCKEPPSFSGEQEMFSECLFSMEKTIKALKPDMTLLPSLGRTWRVTPRSGL